jgi:DNA repair protein RecO (recombination protein O)
MLCTVNGLILRETVYGEADKILTVLTAEYGKITVYAKGVRSFRNRYQSTAQIMSYNEFVLYQKKDSYTFKEAATIENFYPIRNDLDSFALAQYFLDVANDVCYEGERQDEMLQLLLNSLYLIAKKEKSHAQIKAVFELRCASVCGWQPDLSHCATCYAQKNAYYLNLAGGVLLCPDCYRRAEAVGFADADGYQTARKENFVGVTESVLQAMRYVAQAGAERVFAFTLGENEWPIFSRACERYLLSQLERGFLTLDFYHTLKK